MGSPFHSLSSTGSNQNYIYLKNSLSNFFWRGSCKGTKRDVRLRGSPQTSWTLQEHSKSWGCIYHSMTPVTRGGLTVCLLSAETLHLKPSGQPRPHNLAWGLQGRSSAGNMLFVSVGGVRSLGFWKMPSTCPRKLGFAVLIGQGGYWHWRSCACFCSWLVPSRSAVVVQYFILGHHHQLSHWPCEEGWFVWCPFRQPSTQLQRIKYSCELLQIIARVSIWFSSMFQLFVLLWS